MEDEILTECPNCAAQWTMEEMEEQCCGACGYPDPDEDDLDFVDEESNYYSISDTWDEEDLI